MPCKSSLVKARFNRLNLRYHHSLTLSLSFSIFSLTLTISFYPCTFSIIQKQTHLLLLSTSLSNVNVSQNVLRPVSIGSSSLRLAYSHENGLVLVDIIQKCIILNATLGDLYGCSPSIMGNNRDNISIQPFATSSILQHHYQSNASGVASLSSHSEFNATTTPGTTTTNTTATSSTGAGGVVKADTNHNNSMLADNTSGEQSLLQREGSNDNGHAPSLYKSGPTASSTNEQTHLQASSQVSLRNPSTPTQIRIHTHIHTSTH